MGGRLGAAGGSTAGGPSRYRRERQTAPPRGSFARCCTRHSMRVSNVGSESISGLTRTSLTKCVSAPIAAITPYSEYQRIIYGCEAAANVPRR